MAALRAAGAAEHDETLRNPDYMAGAYVSAQLKVQVLAKIWGIRRLVPALSERLLPGGYFYETARVKHVDRILMTELRDGLEQLLILGAGFDSRPYRFADLLRETEVYELDLPALSALKQRKTARILGRLPAHVHYIQADLARDAIKDALGRQSYRLDKSTLIILSGVAPYLPENTVERLLRFTADHTSPRTSIVFDYVYREMVQGDDDFYGAPHLRRRLDALGEPLKSGIPLGRTATFIEDFRLRLVSDLGCGDLVSRYLRRADGTVVGRPYGFVAIAHARVPAATMADEG